MQNKKFILGKIIVSLCISSILVSICFYRYNRHIYTNYIEEPSKEAKQSNSINIDKFTEIIDNAKNNLEDTINFYFNNIGEITPVNKAQLIKNIREKGENFNLYSFDEFKEYVKNDAEKLDELNYGETIVYIYDTKGFINEFEIALPIKYNGNIIGVISNKIAKEQFYDIFEKNDKAHSYIFKKDGEIIFANSNFKENNIYKTLEYAEIKEGYSIQDIKTKVSSQEEFSLLFMNKGIDNYLFFRPLGNGICSLEIMPLSYDNEKILETSRFIFITLIQIISIIFLQIVYLCWIIVKQYRASSKIEMQRIKEMKGLINSVPGGVIKILCNENIEMIFANAGFYNLTGYSENEYKEKFNNNQSNIIYENDLNIILSKLKKASKIKKNINFEYRIIKKNGEMCWLSLTGEYLHKEEDRFAVYQCIVIDSTDYKRILEAFIMEKEQYKIISEISDEIIFEYDMKTDYIQISDKYRETFALNLITKPFIKSILKNKIIHREDLKVFFETIRNIENDDGIFANEIRVKNNFNEYNWAFYQGVTIKNSSGQIDKIVGKISNIDKFKKEIEELKEKSSRDPLTKLYNKIKIEDIVNSYLNRKDKFSCALFIIDIDNFKSINDTFGHIFGDVVLKEITSNITQIFNENEIIARIGGDEFVVFLKDIPDVDYVEKKAELLCDIFRKTYIIENKEYKISASIGITISPKDGLEYSKLLQKADIAVYTAKKEGKDTYKLYNDDMKNINLLNIKKRDNNDQSNRNEFYENILVDVSEMFLKAKDLGTTIKLILSNLCKSFKIERACVFEISEDKSFAFKTYEWHNDNILQVDNENVLFNEQEYLSLYEEKPFLYYENINEIQLNNKILPNYFVQKNGIKSFFGCYFMEQGEIKGYICLENYNSSFLLKNDELEGIFIASRLIGAQILKDKTEKKLDTENQINQAIINNQQLYTYIVKKDTFEVLFYNNKFKNIIPNIEIGKVCYESKGYKAPCNKCPIKQVIGETKINTTKFYCKFANNWLGVTSTQIKWIDKTDAYLICYRDISEYIEQINYIDSLTGASTINKFNVYANNILKNIKNKKDNNSYAILYMDIDKFKYINDTFGYLKGDEFLKAFAMFLYEVLDDEDIFCRVSDDRFLSLIKYKNEEDFIKKIDYIFYEFKKMQEKSFKEMNTKLICGAYKITEEDDNLNFIIDKANIARKSIKGSHQNFYSIYTQEMNDVILKEKLIEGRMKYAIENNEFLPYLQPKFDLNTREVLGAEALVRWEQPNGQMVYPNDFIPIFEKNGFIKELDFYIYEEIFKKIKEWIKSGLKPVPISLNVSRAHINNLEFVDKIVALINKYNIPYNLVELELTESIFSSDIRYLKEIMDSLKLKGFKLSIDDFGSAYSSLNLLKDINVDIIKLDKEFFYKHTNLFEEDFKKDKIIIEYIVKMAKEIGFNVICEGIETESQIEFLRGLGCEMGQGYIFSKPIKIEEFEQKYLK